MHTLEHRKMMRLKMGRTANAGIGDDRRIAGMVTVAETRDSWNTTDRSHQEK